MLICTLCRERPGGWLGGPRLGSRPAGLMATFKTWVCLRGGCGAVASAFGQRSGRGRFEEELWEGSAMATAEGDAARKLSLRTTMLRALQDLNYVVDPSEILLTLDAFLERFGAQPCSQDLKIFTHQATDPADKLLVFFNDDKIVKKQSIEAYWAEMTEKETIRAMVITPARFISILAENILEKNVTHDLMIFQEQEILIMAWLLDVASVEPGSWGVELSRRPQIRMRNYKLKPLATGKRLFPER